MSDLHADLGGTLPDCAAAGCHLTHSQMWTHVGADLDGLLHPWLRPDPPRKVWPYPAEFDEWLLPRLTAVRRFTRTLPLRFRHAWRAFRLNPDDWPA